MNETIINFFKFTKLNHCLKNLIILLPVLISGIQLDAVNAIIFLKGFITLFLLTSACYILNNLKDVDIDKENKLKVSKFLYSKKKSFIIFAFYIIFLLIFVYLNNEVKFKFLLFYLINFLLYNFLTKKIKFIDILFLANFYNLRVFFGADIFDLQLTGGFILLNFCLFLMLSIVKRMIQINVNKLDGNNSLIAYSSIDRKNLMLLAKLSFYLINLVLFLYYFQYLNISQIEHFSTFIVFESDLVISKIFMLHIIFAAYSVYLNKLLLSQKINKDIFDFVVTHKLSYIVVFLIISILFY